MKKPNPGKIAVYLPSLGEGGAEKVMVTLVNAFAARGLPVDLVLARAEGPYLDQVSRDVSIVDFGAGGVAASLPGLVRYLRRERPQAVLSALNHANVVALVARKLAGVSSRIVVSERTNVTNAAIYNRDRGFSSQMVLKLVRLLYPQADRIIAVSQGGADSLARFTGLPRQSIRVVYNPFDLEDIQRQANSVPAHPWFDAGQPPNILSAGRLSQEKDQCTLISAFARVKNKRRVRLLILGEGKLRAELQTHANSLGLSEDDFALPGFVINPFAYMRRAAVFVLTSRYEGLPGVLIQAMACNTAVVATDCPSGPGEILENGKWGRLVPVGDVKALAEAIEATLDEKVHPDVVLRAGYFSVEKAVNQYLEALGIQV